MYNSTLSLTSALDGVGGQRHVPAALPCTHCIESWMGPIAGLEVFGKSRPTDIRSPGGPAVASRCTH